MLLTLSAFLIGAMPALIQSAAQSQTGTAPSQMVRSLTGRDSTRALKFARRAQGDFETARRRLLPRESLGGGGDCQDVVGQYCYRQQITTPPSEAPEIVAARTRLMTTLDSLAALMPNDRWILGQRVRYLMEAGRPLGADSVGIACAARNADASTTSWCLALVGYVAQQLGSYPRADAAFASALEQMPASERCKWQDLALLLGRSAAGPYRHGDCEARDSVITAFWRLVQPLYLRSVNDLRTEYYARITRMYIEQDTRTAMSDWWGSEERETLLRYGVPLWYTQGEVPRGQTRPQIAGFRREPAFNFFPGGHVFASPAELTDEDWKFSSPVDAPTYAPVWAASFLPIVNHQVAIFRRGDSAFIVAAFEVEDPARRGATPQIGAFAAVIDSGGVLTPFGTTIRYADRGVMSTLVAPWRPLIISLEALDSASGTAQRARFARTPPPAHGRLSLSDLLLYTPGVSVPGTLTEAMHYALHSTCAPSDRQVGVFWETYGVRADGEALQYSLIVTPIDEGLFHRALVTVHLAEPDRSLSLQWTEVPTTADGIAARGMAVDLSRLRPGRYSVRLLLTSGADLPIVTERIIQIL